MDSFGAGATYGEENQFWRGAFSKLCAARVPKSEEMEKNFLQEAQKGQEPMNWHWVIPGVAGYVGAVEAMTMMLGRVRKEGEDMQNVILACRRVCELRRTQLNKAKSCRGLLSAQHAKELAAWEDLLAELDGKPASYYMRILMLAGLFMFFLYYITLHQNPPIKDH
ncbi:unnamed protein product [Darwinula stevensoni]|uniref:Uncharacterized protein n=1 Tax=Darwinula stevensoni TaxID=69355 RepID=A0A7R8X4J2_9CRUS|nr:unnamed protein product [Darwinula stevensoni]CAG0883762.1 unnamed protein product [Darwinula stevensoni]